MPPPCGHADYEQYRGIGFVEGNCRRCWLYVNREDYRASFDAGPPEPIMQEDCENLGEFTGEYFPCDCPSKKAEVYWCKIFRICVKTAMILNTPCCRLCTHHPYNKRLLDERRRKEETGM